MIDPTPEERRLLGRLRLVAVMVTLVLLTVVVVASVWGPPGARPSEVLLGTLVGTLLVLLGLAVVPRR